jgi:hypothetical protein
VWVRCPETGEMGMSTRDEPTGFHFGHEGGVPWPRS